MIVVTGGSGFIGSALIWKLNELGFDNILVVDHLGKGIKWKNLVKRKIHTVFHKDDFLPWITSRISYEPIDIVFHLGASSSTTELDGDYLMRNNLQYSQRLWELCSDYSIPLIYASSAATYGAGDKGYDDDPSEIPNLRPLNPYGFSKQLFDVWVQKQRKRPPFWAGLKFFNVYGPQEYHKGGQSSVINQFVPQIQKTGSLQLFKSYREDIPHGEQKRDFVYVKDCIDVMVHLMQEAARAQPGIYNLGSGKAHSFADLGRAVFQAMGYSEPQFEWIEMPEGLRHQYQYFTQANIERLRSQTGYNKPMTSLVDGINDYVKNYLLHADAYL